MEPSLLVIGVNHRTAPVSVRERYWISESRRPEALAQLSASEAVEEVVALATCNRTEFVLWTRDAGAAANSVLRFLSSEYALKLCEWQHFYRKLDEDALVHLFRVASGMDSMVLGEPEIVAQVKAAWALAQKFGTSGRYLDAVFQKALTVSKRVRNETAIGSSATSVPYAAVQLAKQIFGSLRDRKVLLIGAGKMSELSARYLVNCGAKQVCVMNRTLANAEALAHELGGTAAGFEQRWEKLLEADIVISSTSCPHLILTRAETETIAQQREGAPLLLVDIAVPRDIDPAAREVPGVFLYDIDALEHVVEHNEAERHAAASDAQKIVTTEAQQFRTRLLAERVVPTIVALRERLNEICRQELESFRQDAGPFTAEQQEKLEALAGRITQRIAGSLARELKELPERTEQDRMTEAVQRLFHLVQPQRAAAGTSS